MGIVLHIDTYANYIDIPTIPIIIDTSKFLANVENFTKKCFLEKLYDINIDNRNVVHQI